MGSVIPLRLLGLMVDVKNCPRDFLQCEASARTAAAPSKLKNSEPTWQNTILIKTVWPYTQYEWANTLQAINYTRKEWSRLYKSCLLAWCSCCTREILDWIVCMGAITTSPFRYFSVDGYKRLINDIPEVFQCHFFQVYSWLEMTECTECIRWSSDLCSKMRPGK